MATIVKYQSWQVNTLDGTAVIDWDTDTIKVALATSTYTPSASTHDFFNDITNEVTGTGYTAGGATVGSIAVTESSGTATVDGADVTWSQDGSGFTDARYAILYKDTGTATTSPLVGYIDLTTDRNNVDGDFTIEWSASGIFTQA